MVTLFATIVISRQAVNKVPWPGIKSDLIY